MRNISHPSEGKKGYNIIHTSILLSATIPTPRPGNRCAAMPLSVTPRESAHSVKVSMGSSPGPSLPIFRELDAFLSNTSLEMNWDKRVSSNVSIVYAFITK
jgi:hypothetical protein